jgi:hypothetical protein
VDVCTACNNYNHEKEHEKHGLSWKNNLSAAEITKNEGLPPNRAGSSFP